MYDILPSPALQPLPPIEEFPPARIHQLLRDAWMVDDILHHHDKIQLAKAYNDSPMTLDGVIVHNTVDSDGARLLVINPSLIGQQAPARNSTLDMKREEGVVTGYTLAEPVSHENTTTSLPRRLGRLGLAGAGGGFPAYEIGAATENFGVGIVYGAIATAAVYGISKLIGKGRTLGKGIKVLEAFGDWVDKPENGAIEFAQLTIKDNKIVGNDRQVGLIPEAEANHIDQLGRWLGGVDYPDKQLGVRDSPLSVNSIANSIGVIQPGELVRTILSIDAAPAELWTDGFGEKVQALAELEKGLLQDTKILDQAGLRHNHTGHFAPGEEKWLQDLQADMAQRRAALLVLGVEMAEQCQERHKSHQLALQKQKAIELIDKVSSGEVTEPHPKLEMHIQVLHGVACEGLATLDLEEATTIQTAKELHDYLRKTRSLLLDTYRAGVDSFVSESDQLLPFHAGMADKFGDKIHGKFTDWETAVARFSADHNQANA